MRILVLQTAFIGDVILTLPVFQVLRHALPDAIIDGMVIPRAANVLEHQSSVNDVIQFDKRHGDRGFLGAWRKVEKIRARRYDVAIVPHRSIRSAVIPWLAGIPKRIGFDRSAGSFLFTDIIPYQDAQHEVDRNLSLCEPVIGRRPDSMLPILVPTKEDDDVVDTFFNERNWKSTHPLVALAPGTVWMTKQWPRESFVELARLLADAGVGIILVGGKEDGALCEEIKRGTGGGVVMNAAGRLTLRQTASALMRARVLVSNDSAPMHLAVAVGTPVVAIFGATVPAFGFGPTGPQDVVVEMNDLACRPCSIHGTERCPIRTFRCMVDIPSQRVFSSLQQFLTG